MKSPLTQLEQIVLTSKSKNFLKEIANWSSFFSILGFLSILLLIVVAIVIGTVYAPMLDMLTMQQGVSGSGLYIMILFLVIALLYVMPVLYLFKFSRKMKEALATKSDETLAEAFGNLKSHFKFIGVMTIIVISLDILFFVFSIVTGSLV